VGIQSESTEYSITSAPPLPIVISPEGSIGVELAYSPLSVGSSSAILEISSDDPDEPLVEVHLSGTGVGDFAISASPSSQTIRPAGIAAYAVDLTSIDGFNQPITLTVSVTPELADVTLSFHPNPTTPTGTSTLYVSTSDLTTPGSYTLTITGTWESIVHSVTVSLEISGRPVPNPNAGAKYKVSLVTGTASGPDEIAIPSTGIFYVAYTTGPEFAVIDNDATDDPAIIQLPEGNYKVYASGKGGSATVYVNVYSPFIDGYVSPSTTTIEKTSPPTWVDLTSVYPYVLPLPAPSGWVDTSLPWVQQHYPPDVYKFENNGLNNIQISFIT